ncbi:MAG TPA: hypothetical protein VMF14_03850 [Solirubrobacteraceae bacterium]|nr:hypothetical protein [Solirubrobacteraceae bacterium]
MKIAHASLLGGLLSAAVLIVAPAAGAHSGAATARPDLVVRHVETGKPYVLLESSGKSAEIGVRVSLRNAGNTTAPGSMKTTVVLAQSGRQLAQDEVEVGRSLAPGHTITQIAIFHDIEATLGFLHAGARAPGTPTTEVSRPVPVIARHWLARGMEVEESVPGLGFGGDAFDDTNTTLVSFTFKRVEAHPARFVYTAGGEVDATEIISGQCSGRGDSSATMSRWGKDSGLYISTNLKLYEAIVRASLAKPFQFGVSCEGIPATQPTTARFHDLLTSIASGGAPLPMKPTDVKLNGRASSGSVSSLVYTWTILAQVP